MSLRQHTSPVTVRKKPKYNVRSTVRLLKTVDGSNQHCNVPLCSSSSRYNSVLSFHRVPKDTALRAQWLHKIRRAGDPVTPHTVVCSRHFEKDNIRITANGKRFLAARAVPSLFEWNNYASSKAGTPPVSSSLEPNPVETSLEPNPVETSLEPTPPLETSLEPTPVETSLEPTPVETSLEPTPVETSLEPNPVETSLEPNPVETSLEPNPVETSLEPNPVETSLEPNPVETSLEPNPVETSLEPNPVETSLEPNPVETSLEPNPVETSLEPNPVKTEEEMDDTVFTMLVDHDYVASRTVCVDREQYEKMQEEREALRQQLQTLQLQSSFGLQRFASSPEDIRFYTRFPSYEHLMAFWNLISEATAKMVRVTRARKTSPTSTTESPLTRPTKLLPIDELFLFLTYLSTGCPQRELGHRFNIHRATVNRIIVTWANFLYSLLGSICTWMSPAAVKASLPCDFHGSYSDTQVVLYCAELRCQTPSSLLLQSEVFSTYKSHCTFKAMVGMSPHGAVTFVSTLFEGSMSDKEVFRQSGITSLLTPDMAIMVDNGFLVDDLVPGTVHRLAFLSKRTQMPEVDVLKMQSIARLRVHVERMIRRVRENKLFDTTIPPSISESINQLFTVACLLSNYQNGPLVKK